MGRRKGCEGGLVVDLSSTRYEVEYQVRADPALYRLKKGTQQEPGEAGETFQRYTIHLVRQQERTGMRPSFSKLRGFWVDVKGYFHGEDVRWVEGRGGVYIWSSCHRTD